MGGPKDVVTVFKKSGAKILLSAEGFCWPDPSLAVSFLVKLVGKKCERISTIK